MNALTALLALLILVVCSAVADAAGTYTECDGTVGQIVGPDTGVDPGDCLGYTFTDLGDVPIQAFEILHYATLYFWPAFNSSTGPARITIVGCPTGLAKPMVLANCTPIHTNPLTGAGGDPDVQSWSQALGPGFFAVRVDVAPGGGDTARVEIRGH